MRVYKRVYKAVSPMLAFTPSSSPIVFSKGFMSFVCIAVAKKFIDFLWRFGIMARVCLSNMIFSLLGGDLQVLGWILAIGASFSDW